MAKGFGKKTFAKANKHAAKKVSYNPASGSVVRKDSKYLKSKDRLYFTTPNGSPATHPVSYVGKDRYNTGKPSKARNAVNKAAASSYKSNGFKSGKAIPKVNAKLYVRDHVRDNYGIGGSARSYVYPVTHDKSIMKKRSTSSASAVAYPYSPGGYGNLGLAGSSASSVANSDLSDPYAALKYMQDSNTALNVYMNQENNRFAADQARINRLWEENMANTAHQREVKDLQAAGLNPVLSANAGAAVPAGSAAGSSNFVGADSSAIHAIASIVGAAMSSNATTTAAALSANASMYGSDQSRAASEYSAKMGYKGTQFTATHGKGTKAVGDWKYAIKYLEKLSKKYNVDLGQIYRRK